MKKLLVVVDYQNDFVSGSLGFEGAKDIDDQGYALDNVDGNVITKLTAKQLREGVVITITFAPLSFTTSAQAIISSVIPE